MATTTEFAYQPLVGDDIRLIALLPAADINETIECTISHASLKDPPSYEALSYTWGDPNRRAVILLDDRPFEVTANLEVALQHLRRKDSRRTIWVDAISIDQSNIVERGIQILRMTEIYKRPWRVLVWLGPEGNGSDIAMEKLLEVRRSEPAFRDAYMTSEREYMKLMCRLGLHNEDSPEQPRIWEALQSLFAREWWGRVWTVQEATGPAETVFICGSHLLHMNDLEVSTMILRPLWMRLGNYKTHKAMYLTLLVRPGILMVHRNARMNPQSSHPESFRLFNIFALFRNKQASDERDIVYGLLNLAQLQPNLEHLLRPDYSLTVEAVYIATAKYLILEQGNLELFQCCGYQSRPGLPSWVPSWTDPLENGIPKWAGPATTSDSSQRYFCAHAGRSMKVQFQDDDKSLILKGVSFDRISRTGNVCPYIASDTDEVFAWHSLAMSWQSSYKTTEEIERAFSCTIKADLRILVQQVMCRGARTYCPPGVEDDEDNHYPGMELSALSNRRFALTENGAFGLVPSNTMIGDIVCVLYGCELPCVLRSKGSSGTYQLIGECYVHEKVDGQVIGDLERGILEEGTFRIV